MSKCGICSQKEEMKLLSRMHEGRGHACGTKVSILAPCPSTEYDVGVDSRSKMDWLSTRATL